MPPFYMVRSEYSNYNPMEVGETLFFNLEKNADRYIEEHPLWGMWSWHKYLVECEDTPTSQQSAIASTPSNTGICGSPAGSDGCRKKEGE